MRRRRWTRRGRRGRVVRRGRESRWERAAVEPQEGDTKETG